MPALIRFSLLTGLLVAAVTARGRAADLPAARLEIVPVCYGGIVSVDRVDVGHLPLAPLPVASGFHLVEVSCGGRERFSALVWVAPGLTVKVAPPAPSPDRPVSDGGRVGAGATRETEPINLWLTGHAGLGVAVVRSEGEPGDATRAAVENAFTAALGPGRPDAWRLLSTVNGRSRLVGGTEGEPERGGLTVAELSLRTPRLQGFRAEGGRMTLVVPGTTTEPVDGGRLEWAAGAVRVRGGAARPLGAGVGPVAGVAVATEDLGASLDGDAVRARSLSSTLSLNMTDTSSIFGQALLEDESLAWATLRAALELDDTHFRAWGRWGGVADRELGPALANPHELLNASRGWFGGFSALARGRDLRVEGEVEAGGGGGRARLEARVDGRFLESGTAVERLEPATSSDLPGVTRMVASLRARPTSRWRLLLEGGPERVQWLALAPVSGKSTGLGARTEAGFALAPDVWIRVGAGVGPADLRVVPDARRVADGFLRLEIW